MGWYLTRNVTVSMTTMMSPGGQMSEASTVFRLVSMKGPWFHFHLSPIVDLPIALSPVVLILSFAKSFNVYAKGLNTLLSYWCFV